MSSNATTHSDEDHYASIRPRAEDGKTKQIITLKAILRRSVFFAAKVAESDDAAQAGINCWAQTWPIHIDSKYKVVRQCKRSDGWQPLDREILMLCRHKVPREPKRYPYRRPLSLRQDKHSRRSFRASPRARSS